MTARDIEQLVKKWDNWSYHMGHGVVYNSVRIYANISCIYLLSPLDFASMVGA